MEAGQVGRDDRDHRVRLGCHHGELRAVQLRHAAMDVSIRSNHVFRPERFRRQPQITIRGLEDLAHGENPDVCAGRDMHALGAMESLRSPRSEVLASVAR